MIDQIGKNISGSGMDPNATGRPNTGLPGFEDVPDINQIVVRDLTEATHGNATGLSGADVTTQRVVSKMDWSMTYVNIVTSASYPAQAAARGGYRSTSHCYRTAWLCPRAT